MSKWKRPKMLSPETLSAGRMAWVSDRLPRYLEYGHQVAESPYGQVAMFEFAIISAHTPQDVAVRGFLATRSQGLMDWAIGDLLAQADVIAPGRKAGYIRDLRAHWGLWIPKVAGPLPAYRATVKIGGLHWTKMSFGLALGRPLVADVACLDTNVLQALGYGNQMAKVQRDLALYKQVENILATEAAQVGLSTFLYQWAIWDMWRGKTDPHWFLWADPPKQGRLV